jgi:hypothetical protein
VPVPGRVPEQALGQVLEPERVQEPALEPVQVLVLEPHRPPKHSRASALR